MPVKLTLLSAGYCNGQENHTLRNGRRVSRRYPALFALLQHPTEGYILFDTGYARRFYDVTRYFPNRLYNLITPVTITEEETAVSKLSALGIQPQQIRYVIVSHFHADHVAGTKDFPNARFICSETACIFARNTRGLRALSAAYIPELLPDDFLTALKYSRLLRPVTGTMNFGLNNTICLVMACCEWSRCRAMPADKWECWYKPLNAKFFWLLMFVGIVFRSGQ
jgi:hypothetical protein